MTRYISLKLNVDKVVTTTSNHGGYRGGECIACDASGWLDGYGYPNSMKGQVLDTHLIHTARCPMNEYLKDDGSLLRRKLRTRKSKTDRTEDDKVLEHAMKMASGERGAKYL